MSAEANADEAGNEGVHPHVFVSELARQVYADLDGVLSEDGRATADATATLHRAASAGAPRISALWLLLRSGLAAFHALRFGRDTHFIEPSDDEVHAAMAASIPGFDAPAAVASAAARVAGAMHLAENRAETLHSALALAVYRLYDGLRTDNERLSASGLIELRTMVAHLDAAAGLEAATLVGVVRPDRFHDDFLRYVSAAQGDGAGDAQQAVATLQQDGRITAVVTHDVHPVEHARQAVAADQGIACIRIEALLDFLQRHRDAGEPLVRAANSNETVFTALITAAATSPLASGAGFNDAVLTQIARYNLRLLQAVTARPDHVH